jgi:hypothetical protein
MERKRIKIFIIVLIKILLQLSFIAKTPLNKTNKISQVTTIEQVSQLKKNNNNNENNKPQIKPLKKKIYK